MRFKHFFSLFYAFLDPCGHQTVLTPYCRSISRRDICSSMCSFTNLTFSSLLHFRCVFLFCRSSFAPPTSILPDRKSRHPHFCECLLLYYQMQRSLVCTSFFVVIFWTFYHSDLLPISLLQPIGSIPIPSLCGNCSLGNQFVQIVPCAGGLQSDILGNRRGFRFGIVCQVGNDRLLHSFTYRRFFIAVFYRRFSRM